LSRVAPAADFGLTITIGKLASLILEELFFGLFT
jgi:hypothetical protein